MFGIFTLTCANTAVTESRLGDAVNLLVAAQTHTHSANSAATRSWLAAREAEVRALRAEVSEVDRAVERAVSVYDYARPEFERSWTGFFTPSRLGSMVVTSYMRVDHRDLALQADAVIASLSPTEAKIKAVILADLTAAAITSADLGRAAVLGQEALHATLTHEATLGAARLRNVQTMIVPRRGHDRTLDDLHDAIAAQL